MSTIGLYLRKESVDEAAAFFSISTQTGTTLARLYIWARKYRGPLGGREYTTRRNSAVTCYPLFSGGHTCQSTLDYFKKLGFDTSELQQTMVDLGWEYDIKKEK